MNVIITDHAKQRAKERAGLPAKSVERIARKALINGIEDSRLKGEISGWVINKLSNYADNRKFYLYGDKAWIFALEGSDHVLITLLQLPADLCRKVRNIA